MTTTVDLAELDRLRCAAMENPTPQHISEWYDELNRAYPAMAAELRELRAKNAELVAMLDEAEPIIQTRGPKP